MKICNDCHTVLCEDQLIAIRDDLGLPAELVSGRTAPEEYEICPYCKSEEIESAVECCICAEFSALIDADYLGSDNYVCKECGDEIMKRFCAEFDENEQALILEREC